MVFTDFIPPENVRTMRHAMRESLTLARQQVHRAKTPEDHASARAHLNLVCDMLDALGWDDLDDERPVEVERVRVGLRRHLATQRELAKTHNPEARQQAEAMAVVIEALLTMVEPS